jgi:hypothetical protein
MRPELLCLATTMVALDDETLLYALSRDAILLNRRAQVFLPHSNPGAGTSAPDIDAGVTLLGCELLDRGYLLSADLHRALAGLNTQHLHAVGRTLLEHVDEAVGAHRIHMPLFRNFPDSVPADTLTLYVERVLACLFQAPEQPCVLCGTEGQVHPVRPCAHLVCRSRFDGGDYNGCPICNRCIDPDDPFPHPAKPRPTSTSTMQPRRARVLHLGGAANDLEGAAARELNRLLERTGALSPQDTDDLLGLLDALGQRRSATCRTRSRPGRPKPSSSTGH